MNVEDIILQNVTEKDLPTLFQWFNDESSYGEFDEPSRISKKKLREKFINGGFSSDDQGTLIIFNGKNPVGFLNFLKDPFDSWIMFMGTVIAIEDMRNRGIGTIAQKMGARYIFDNYPTVQKIEAVTDKDHIAERRSLEKAGFTFEGILRNRNLRRGKFYDMAYYGILRSEI